MATMSAMSVHRPSLRAYIVADTLVGTAVNVVFSAGFTWLVFHADARVLASSLVIDAIPQSFMVALMSVLPVSLLTRARARRGRPIPFAPRGAWMGPKNFLVRALVIAAVAGVAGFLGFRLLTPTFAPAGLTFVHALILKSIFGAILTIVIVPLAAIAALKDAA